MLPFYSFLYQILKQNLLYVELEQIMNWLTDILKQRQGLKLFIPMVLLYASSYFQRTAVPGTIFSQLQENNLTAFQISMIGASFVYIYSFLQLIVGMLADRYGGIRIIKVGGACFCLGVLVFPLVSSTWAMCLCRVLSGIGAGTLYLSLLRENDRMFGRANYAVVLGAIYFIGYGGGLVGTLPFERVISYIPWRWALLGAGIFSIFLYACFWSVASKISLPEIDHRKFSFKPLGRIIKNRYSWLLILSSTVNFATYYIIQTMFGKKLLEDIGHLSSASAAGTIFALTFVCMVVLFSSSLISRLMGNLRKPLLMFSACLNLANTIMMLLAVTFSWSHVFLIIGCQLFAVASGFNAIFSMTIQEINSQEVMTQAAGLINMINYFAVALFSMIIGAILTHYGENINGIICYSRNSYQLLFMMLLPFSIISVCLLRSVPETHGKYQH